MGKYIALVSFTEEGIKKVRDTAKRAKKFAQAVRKKGIAIKQTYWTTGRFDLIHVFEASSEEDAAAFSFALGSCGNVRTETYRVYDIGEMTKILGETYDIQVEGGLVT
jgi:uncharacterized protein with GYD domain